jgi:hypothetical protein
MFLNENLKERVHQENLDAHGCMILEWIRGIGREFLNWIHLLQDKVKWLPCVNTVRNLGFPCNLRGISWVAEQLLASHVPVSVQFVTS